MHVNELVDHEDFLLLSSRLKLIREEETSLGEVKFYRSLFLKRTFVIEYDIDKTYAVIKALYVKENVFNPIEFNFNEEKQVWVESLCNLEFHTLEDALEFFAG